VTDEIDVVQRVLEGRCWLCNIELPDHTVDCKLNPNREVLDKLTNIQVNIDAKLQTVKRMIDSNQVNIDELEQLLQEIKFNAHKTIIEDKE
jgi:hypothetical protein